MEFAALYPLYAKALGVAAGRDRRAYLLPDAFRQADRMGRWGRRAGRGFVALAGLLALVQLGLQSELRAAKLQLAASRENLASVESLPALAEQFALRQRSEASQALLAQFVHYPVVLDWHLRELAQLTPPEIVLDRVVLQPGPADSLSHQEAHAFFPRLEIAGSATAPYAEADAVLVNFIRQLERSPFFGTASIVSRTEERFADRKRVLFQLEIDLQ